MFIFCYLFSFLEFTGWFLIIFELWITNSFQTLQPFLVLVFTFFMHHFLWSHFLPFPLSWISLGLYLPTPFVGFLLGLLNSCLLFRSSSKFLSLFCFGSQGSWIPCWPHVDLFIGLLFLLCQNDIFPEKGYIGDQCSFRSFRPKSFSFAFNLIEDFWMQNSR